MVAFAPIPIDEAARLRALLGYHVLDTPPDERFDLFPRLCTWVYNTPLAAINLVHDDWTFFKSLIGFPPYKPRRATSICAHAVGNGNPVMVVEDLTKDDRFHDHPLALKGMVFYAGALLWSGDGHALGTLCIGDTHPRGFSGMDQSKLIEMAKGVSAVLELHRSSVLLRQIAHEDALTGLLNRRAFMELLDAAVARPQAACAAVLLCLDLDGFKQVNDTYGHPAGDALLQEAGRRLTATVRSGDAVARLGGDEFAILLGDTCSMALAEELAQRILQAFQPLFMFGDAALRLRTSIGVAVAGADGAPICAGDLIHRADQALYQAKQSGRGQYMVSQADRGQTLATA